MLATALALMCVALAVAAVIDSLRISRLERRADKDRALLRELQRDQRDLRQVVEHDRAQLRRAELQVDAVANRLGLLREELTARLDRLERVVPTIEDDVVKLLSQPPEL